MCTLFAFASLRRSRDDVSLNYRVYELAKVEREGVKAV